MKRVILIACLACAAWVLPVAVAEESPASAHKGKSGDLESGSSTLWLTVNFLVLGGGLGYLIGKNAGGFFRSRDEALRKDIEDATRRKAEAEARVAEISSKMANLQAEIEALRRDAHEEITAEGARIREETDRHLAKINAQAKQEIESAEKAARQELRAYGAKLAIRLAEQQVSARMTAAGQEALLDSFVADLKRKPQLRTEVQ